MFRCFFLLVIVVSTSILGEDLYSFTVKDADGNDISLEKYRGKVSRSDDKEQNSTKTLIFS